MHSDRDKEGERQIEIVIEKGRSDCSTICVCVCVWKISLFLRFTPNWNPPTEPMYELTNERQFADSIFRVIFKYKKKYIYPNDWHIGPFLSRIWTYDNYRKTTMSVLNKHRSCGFWHFIDWDWHEKVIMQCHAHVP